MGIWDLLFRPRVLPELTEVAVKSRQAHAGVPTALEEMPRIALSEARPGAAQRFSGSIELVAGDEPLIAPLSERPCVYYELTVEVWRRNGDLLRFGSQNDPLGSYEILLFDWNARDFDLVDAGLRARVHQRRPAVLLRTDRKLERKIGKAFPTDLQAVIDRLAPDKARRFPRYKGVKVVVREAALEVGKRVNVWATPAWKTRAEQAGYRDDARELWLEGGDDPAATFVISNLL